MKLNTISSRIEEIIATEVVEGDGTERNPSRVVTSYWTKNGELLAAVDPYREVTE